MARQQRRGTSPAPDNKLADTEHETLLRQAQSAATVGRKSTDEPADEAWLLRDSGLADGGRKTRRWSSAVGRKWRGASASWAQARGEGVVVLRQPQAGKRRASRGGQHCGTHVRSREREEKTANGELELGCLLLDSRNRKRREGSSTRVRPNLVDKQRQQQQQLDLNTEIDSGDMQQEQVETD